VRHAVRLCLCIADNGVDNVCPRTSHPVDRRGYCSPIKRPVREPPREAGYAYSPENTGEWQPRTGCQCHGRSEEATMAVVPNAHPP
jgi:hypothetical protein